MAQTRTYSAISAFTNGDLNAAFGWTGFGAGIPNTGSDADGVYQPYVDAATIAFVFANDGAIPSNASSVSVAVAYRSKSDDATRQITPYIRYTGGSALYGSAITPASSYGNTSRTFALDPNSAAWTISNIFQTKFGIQSQAYGSTVSVYGTDIRPTVTFTLPTPTSTTGAATNVTTVAATLNGTLNPNGATATYPCSYYFEWGLTSSYGNTTSTTGSQTGSASLPATASISGLTANTTYHFRLVVTNADTTVYGSDQTFQTASSDRSLLVM